MSTVEQIDSQAAKASRQLEIALAIAAKSVGAVKVKEGSVTKTRIDEASIDAAIGAMDEERLTVASKAMEELSALVNIAVAG